MITPDRIVSTTCPYCGVGCNLELHVKDEYIYKVTSPFDSVVNQGNLCVKGRFGYDFIYHPTARDHPADPRARPRQPGSARRPSIWPSGASQFPGTRRWIRSPTGWSRSTTAMVPRRWRSTAAPKPPTRTTTCCRRCSVPCSAPTTSTTARACATPGRWWRCSRRSAPRR